MDLLPRPFPHDPAGDAPTSAARPSNSLSRGGLRRGAGGARVRGGLRVPLCSAYNRLDPRPGVAVDAPPSSVALAGSTYGPRARPVDSFTLRSHSPRQTGSGAFALARPLLVCRPSGGRRAAVPPK